MRSIHPPDGERSRRIIEDMVLVAFEAGRANVPSETMVSIAMRIARFSAVLHATLCMESMGNDALISANVVRDWALLRLGGLDGGTKAQYVLSLIRYHREEANKVMRLRGIAKHTLATA